MNDLHYIAEMVSALTPKAPSRPKPAPPDPDEFREQVVRSSRWRSNGKAITEALERIVAATGGGKVLQAEDELGHIWELDGGPLDGTLVYLDTLDPQLGDTIDNPPLEFTVSIQRESMDRLGGYVTDELLKVLNRHMKRSGDADVAVGVTEDRAYGNKALGILEDLRFVLEGAPLNVTYGHQRASLIESLERVLR